MGYYIRIKRRYDKSLADLLEKHDEFMNVNDIFKRMSAEYNTIEKQYVDEEVKENHHKSKLAREASDYNSIMNKGKGKHRSAVKKKHLSKMYRRIVEQTHPDKLEQLGLTEDERFNRENIFKELVPAYKKLNVPIFFDCASEVGIIPQSVNQMEFFSTAFETEMQILEEKITTLKGTVAWSLHNCGDDVQCRERIVKQTTESIYK